MLDLVRQIETSALHLREGELPGFGLELEETSIDVALPTDRPLFTARPAAEVNSLLDPVDTEEVDTSVLTDQVVVDPARLASRIRELTRSAAPPAWRTSSPDTPCSTGRPRSSATWRSRTTTSR